MIACPLHQVWTCAVFGNVLSEPADVEIGSRLLSDFVVFLEQSL